MKKGIRTATLLLFVWTGSHLASPPSPTRTVEWERVKPWAKIGLGIGSCLAHTFISLPQMFTENRDLSDLASSMSDFFGGTAENELDDCTVSEKCILGIAVLTPYVVGAVLVVSGVQDLKCLRRAEEKQSRFVEPKELEEEGSAYYASGPTVFEDSEGSQ